MKFQANVEEKMLHTTVAEPYTRERVEEVTPVGQTKITQAGQDGVRTIVTRQYLVDGKVREARNLQRSDDTNSIES